MLDISKLKNGTLEKIDFDEIVNFTDDDIKDTSTKRLSNVRAKGSIERINDDIYHLTLNITGDMVLLCARSLEEVVYPIDIFIDKNVSETTNEDEKPIILQNSLDIFGIVWENIVLEVPLRVVKENAEFLSEGNGWSLIEENDDNTNLPFGELKSMLDMEEKR